MLHCEGIIPCQSRREATHFGHLATTSQNPAIKAPTLPGFAALSGRYLVNWKVVDADADPQVTAAPASAVVGQPVTFTATVNAQPPGAGTPTGTVQFFDNDTPVGISGRRPSPEGPPRAPCPTRPAGRHVYGGLLGRQHLRQVHLGRASVSVGPATSTVTVAATPSNPVFGHSVTLKATVAVTAPGSTSTAGTHVLRRRRGRTRHLRRQRGSGHYGHHAVDRRPARVTARYSGTPALSPSTSVALAVTVGYGSPCATGTTPGSVTVGKGQIFCAGPSARINGSITVQAGGSLSLTGAVVGGGITANSPAAVTICGSTLRALSLAGAKGFVLVGDGAADCPADSMAGPSPSPTTSAGSSWPATRSAARSVTGNSGAGPLPGQPVPIVRSDVVGGSLTCSSNAPTVDDSGNKVSGATSGQCAIAGTTVTVAVRRPVAPRRSASRSPTR